MRTVFVIGAGANAEIGMPSGDELKMKIANILDFTPRDRGMFNGDKTVYNTLRTYYYRHYGHIDLYKAGEFVDIAECISRATPLSISIDNFIDARRGDQQIAFCGKLTIVYAILEAEFNCALSVINNKTLQNEILEEAIDADIEQLNRSWYPLIFKKITEGCSIEELTDRLNNISFIIFNYDRCFEYFMYKSLMIYYSLEHHRAKEIVQQLHINHPYGTVGKLWDNRGELTFGEIPNTEQLILLAQNIKTFTESVEQEKDSSNRIQYLVERADRIIFLGFAYHEQNLDLLFKHNDIIDVTDNVPISKNIICYGTGYGISDNDLDRLRKTLQIKCEIIKDCDISRMTCSQFFRDFWYRLTFKSHKLLFSELLTKAAFVVVLFAAVVRFFPS